MNIEKFNTAGPSNPRFEFRSFGQNFDNAAKRMARLSMPVDEKFWEADSDEIYIVSQATDTTNAKIRDGKLDIKILLQAIDGLEQWQPLMKVEFPVAAVVLKDEVCPALQVELPEQEKHLYSCNEFIKMVHHHPKLQAVNVQKKRYSYIVNNTICETGTILLNGARVITISSESTVIEDVKKTIRDIGLAGVENINYVQAIKRVTGMINKPLAN